MEVQRDMEGTPLILGLETQLGMHKVEVAVRNQLVDIMVVADRDTCPSFPLNLFHIPYRHCFDQPHTIN